MDSVINAITKVNDFIKSLVWGWPAIIMILFTGIFLSMRTKFLQVRKFPNAINATLISSFKKSGKKREKGKISPFEAFAAAISGTVGTGNIIGVTSAILTGGPGAVLWMWISAFFGMVTNFAENVLGLYYRKQNEDGSFEGGAFYYIAHGVKWKWLAYVAAVFCAIAAIGMSGVQTNKITDTLTSAFGTDSMTVKLVIGISIAVITAIIIIGGISRISKVAALLVPVMSVLFMLLAIIAICMNARNFPAALTLIFKNAFTFKSAASGIMGYGLAEVIRKGMARGVFSNEAGLGSSVIAHCSTDNKEPVEQGLWGVFGVFFDSFIICSLTAFMVLTTFDLTTLDAAFDASGVALDSFIAMNVFTVNFGTFGKVCFAVILPLFAFSTILAWAYYGESAVVFIFGKLGKRGVKISVQIFKVIYILLIVFSAIVNGELIWSIADTANGLMALPNLLALIILSGQVVKITRNYYARKKGENLLPMLSAYPEQNEKFIKQLDSQSQ